MKTKNVVASYTSSPGDKSGESIQSPTISGLDGYKRDSIGEDSLGSFYILKRREDNSSKEDENEENRFECLSYAALVASVIALMVALLC